MEVMQCYKVPVPKNTTLHSSITFQGAAGYALASWPGDEAGYAPSKTLACEHGAMLQKIVVNYQ